MEFDFKEVIPLTESKTKSVIGYGYNITGFVLTNATGEKCIVDMSAVRWLDYKDFFGMMHNEFVLKRDLEKNDAAI